MIQCSQCEFCRKDDGGRIHFSCDPFSTIKEPECLTKWQLLKTDQMVQAYQATLAYYRRLAPMQEKMFKVIQREMDDINESEKWKIDDDEEEASPEGDERPSW